jgi:hypothetical protein
MELLDKFNFLRFKPKSENKLRDIEITLSYCRGATLHDLGRRYYLTPERIRAIVTDYTINFLKKNNHLMLNKFSNPYDSVRMSALDSHELKDFQHCQLMTEILEKYKQLIKRGGKVYAR